MTLRVGWRGGGYRCYMHVQLVLYVLYVTFSLQTGDKIYEFNDRLSALTNFNLKDSRGRGGCHLNCLEFSPPFFKSVYMYIITMRCKNQTVSDSETILVNKIFGYLW